MFWVKKYIAPICWLIGAIIWFLTAFTYFAEGKKVFAIIQFILSMLFMANGIYSFIRKIKQ